VIRAGEAISRQPRRMKVRGKDDGSPVTEPTLRRQGDREGSRGSSPASLVVEERPSGEPPYRGSFFLIDPLDGTKEFVAGRNEFTINLALVSEGRPLLGFVGARRSASCGAASSARAERVTLDGTKIKSVEPIRTRPCPAPGKPWTVAVSRSHGNDRTERLLQAPGAVRPNSLGREIRPRRRRGRRHLSRLAHLEWDVRQHAVVTRQAAR